MLEKRQLKKPAKLFCSESKMPEQSKPGKTKSKQYRCTCDILNCEFTHFQMGGNNFLTCDLTEE